MKTENNPPTHSPTDAPPHDSIYGDRIYLKKPVITVKFTKEHFARIFLFEKKVGKEVKTRAALRKTTKAFLDDPKTKVAMLKGAETFAKNNEHFLRADNAKRVMREVVQDLSKRK